MNNSIRKQAEDIILSRIEALAASTGSVIIRHGIHREAETAIDMAGLCGAIDITQQRHYKERLSRIVSMEGNQP
ncbi:hypothetical protein [Pseudomonas sp. A014]|uniref:hypothetical protein n=1 Tax=Pseudomonas sp. A014 TaxID=3458058 RepID=UPI004036E6CD